MTVSNEVEETVLSFENQLENLSNENDKLKTLIKEKDIIIKNLKEENILLNQQNEMYKELIDKSNLTIEDNNKESNKEGPKFLDFNKMKKALEKDEKICICGITSNECKDCYPDNKKNNIVIDDTNEKIKLEKELNKIKKENERLIIEIKDIKQDYIKIQNNKNDNNDKDIYKNPEFIKIKLEKEQLEEQNTKKFDELNETIDSLRTQINSIPSEDKIKEKVKLDFEKEIETKYKNMYEEKLKKEKIKKSRNRESSECSNIEINDIANNLLKRYPIIIYREIDGNEVKDMVASECSFIVKYQYEISTKTNKKEEISINEVVDYIIKQENLSRPEKHRLLNKYERCEYLHKTYDDKLNIFKFDLDHISVMTKEEWKIWLQELHKLIKKEYPEDINENVIFNKCDYVYTKGKNKGEKCNKIECRTKSHKKVH